MPTMIEKDLICAGCDVKVGTASVEEGTEFVEYCHCAKCREKWQAKWQDEEEENYV